MSLTSHFSNALTVAAFIILPVFTYGQSQTIRGTVIDKATRQPLPGATVTLPDLGEAIGTVSDFDGTFLLKDIPPGRYTVACNFIGYAPWQADGLVLSTARGLVLDIELKEDVSVLGEVLVTAITSSHGPLNDAALLSARSFSVEEVQHYAGALNDPGRMAHSLPGVQPSKDNEGDLVVRGNASTGILWRLEGVDILNPNHFARLGGSGGGLSIFSVSVLSTSDFFSGAFPAEYGNALSGVFDMRFRNGNREQRQHRLRAGMLGLEFATEGPFSGKSTQGAQKGSYLLNYRYSTLGILKELGIYLVGARVRNNFQDLSFNLFFPGKNGKSSLRLWGTGGLSFEEKLVESATWKISDDSLNYKSGSDVGILGLTHTLMTSEKSHLKTTVAVMRQRSFFTRWRNTSAGTKKALLDQDYKQAKLALSTFFTQRLSAKGTFKTGLQISSLSYDLSYDSIQTSGQLADYISEKGALIQVQPFVQFSYQPSAAWILNFGLHGFYFGLTESFSIEPRFSVRTKLGNKQSISFAAGLHSQAVPLGVYFANVSSGSTISQPNRNLPLMKSFHAVLAYDYQLSPQLRFHLEVYLQNLSAIPGHYSPSQVHWLLNEIEGYPILHHDDSGKGRNSGLDISLEKSFRKGFFFLLNGSVFESIYNFDGSPDFNTQFNANYMASLTMAKEWVLKKGGAWQLGMKNLWVNGLPGTPLAAVQINSESPTLDYSKPFSERIPDYFRADLRLAWRKGGHSLSLDVQNVFNVKNKRPFGWQYSREESQWLRRDQAGVVPVVSWQLDL